MKCSEAVFAVRTGHGWTQAAMARHLGRGLSTIANWEQGANAPRPAECARLAELAGDGSPLREFFLARAGDYAQQTGPGEELRAQVAQLALALDRMERRLAALERAASAPQADRAEGISLRPRRRA